MRTNDIGDVIATDDKGGIAGIVTDRDIVVRGVAAGLSPVDGLVRDCMTPDVAWAFEDEDSEDDDSDAGH